MANEVTEVAPRKLNADEAYRGGKLGYRIHVEMNGNPFKGPLADAWLSGWRDAAASDTTSAKRIDYAALEDRFERKPKARGKTSGGRGHKETR